MNPNASLKSITDRTPLELLSEFQPGMDKPRRSWESLNWHYPNPDKKQLCVQFVGPNGAGKSVFDKILHALDPDAYWIVGQDGKTRIATIFPNIGWAAGGYYRSETGGCDCLEKDSVFEAMFKLTGSDLNWSISGSILSNSKNTYWDAFKAIEANFPNRVPLFVMMDYPLETYIKRIKQRNGGKEIKEDPIIQKFTNISRYRDYYLSDRPDLVHVESSEGIDPMVHSVMNVLEAKLGRNIFDYKLKNRDQLTVSRIKPIQELM